MRDNNRSDQRSVVAYPSRGLGPETRDQIKPDRWRRGTATNLRHRTDCCSYQLSAVTTGCKNKWGNARNSLAHV